MAITIGDEAWLPYWDVICYLKKYGTEKEKEYYSQFGFEQIEIDATKYPLLASKQEALRTRFDEKYSLRMISQETLERWQVRLQNRFDEIAEKMEIAYQVYTDNKAQILTDLNGGYELTGTGTLKDQNSGTSTDNGKSKHSDTPDTQINESDDFAGSIDIDTRTGSSSGTLDRATSDHTDMKTKGELLERTNKLIDGWIEVDEKVLSSFENLFLNVFYY